MRFRIALFCGAATLSLLTASTAFAQAVASADQTGATSAATQSQASVPASPDQLQDIVVTAQRRAENLQRVPVAVTVASGEALRAEQIVNPAQLIFVAPSLQQQATAGEVGATNFAIRGIGSAIFGNGIESSVATVYDDVTLARPQFGISPFFDIDNVQVLRGPQGMLFGKNASAGVISINTKRPELGVTSFDGYVSSGVHDTVGAPLVMDGNGTLNLPIGQNAAIRASAFVVQNGSYIDNLGNPSSNFGLAEFGGRLKALWRPTDALEIYIAGEYVRGVGKGDGVFTERVNAPGGVLGALQSASGITAGPDNLTVNDGARSYNYLNSGNVQANVKYTFGSGHSLTNIVAHRFYYDRLNNDFDQTPYSLADTFYSTRNYVQTSEELRFASPDDSRLKYQAGLYYLTLGAPGSFIQGAQLQPLLPIVPGFTRIGSNRYYALTSQSYAVFGQAEYRIVDGLSVLAGGRFTHDRNYLRNTYDTTNILIPTVTPGVVENRVQTDNFSYRVGLNYQISPSLFAYALYSRGYKGPAFDQTTLRATNPEIPYNIEGGIKTQLLDRRLVLNVSGYHTIFRDFEAQAFAVLPGQTVGNFTTVNAGRLRVQGVEADFRALPFRGFTLSGGMSYNDGVYATFTGAPCYAGEAKATSGQFVCLPNNTSDVSGGQLANAPRVTFNVAGQYEMDVRGGKAFLGADLYHRSSDLFSPTQDPRTRVPGIDLVGMRVGFRGASDRWSFTVFTRNVFDKRFATFIVQNSIGTAIGDDAKGGDYYQTFGSESFRTIGASFSLHL